MAMKYIYSLKNGDKRNFYDLRIERVDIESVIEEMFEDNLKDVYVDSDYFEFVLKKSISVSKLREMGKRLKRVCSHKNGFVRQAQKMYAIAKRSDDVVDVDFIDKCIISSEFENRMSQSKMFERNLAEWINRINYVDIYSAQFTMEEFKKYFNDDNLPSERLYEVDLMHRHIGSNVFSDKSMWFAIEHLYTEDEKYYEYYDIASVHITEFEPNNETLEEIKNRMSIKDPLLSESEPHSPKMKFGKGKYSFKVHNVGQGLATSISYQNSIPHFYFDYGIAYGRNKFTTPSSTKLVIQDNGIIALSHLHEDHWCGIRINGNALKAKWLVPTQMESLRFNHLIARIKYEGGEVIRYNGISKRNIVISNSKDSSICPGRHPNSKHQCGYAMYIHANRCDNNETCFILVSGDQEYDYQDARKLVDINILVACHHGGEYCWSKKGSVPIPSNKYNEIIYSYGKCNSYKHPSKISDYAGAGWKNRFDTINGDYSIDIYI